MTADEMLRLVLDERPRLDCPLWRVVPMPALKFNIELPKVAPEPLRVHEERRDAVIRRAFFPEQPPEPAGFSFTVTRFELPVTCTREELGWSPGWGWNW